MVEFFCRSKFHTSLEDVKQRVSQLQTIAEQYQGKRQREGKQPSHKSIKSAKHTKGATVKSIAKVAIKSHTPAKSNGQPMMQSMQSMQKKKKHKR